MNSDKEALITTSHDVDDDWKNDTPAVTFTNPLTDIELRGRTSTPRNEIKVPERSEMLTLNKHRETGSNAGISFISSNMPDAAAGIRYSKSRMSGKMQDSELGTRHNGSICQDAETNLKTVKDVISESNSIHLNSDRAISTPGYQLMGELTDDTTQGTFNPETIPKALQQNRARSANYGITPGRQGTHNEAFNGLVNPPMSNSLSSNQSGYERVNLMSDQQANNRPNTTSTNEAIRNDRSLPSIPRGSYESLISGVVIEDARHFHSTTSRNEYVGNSPGENDPGIEELRCLPIPRSYKPFLWKIYLCVFFIIFVAVAIVIAYQFITSPGSMSFPEIDPNKVKLRTPNLFSSTPSPFLTKIATRR